MLAGSRIDLVDTDMLRVAPKAADAEVATLGSGDNLMAVVASLRVSKRAVGSAVHSLATGRSW